MDMKGIFEIINAGIQSKTFDGKTNHTLACLQDADLTHVKIPDEGLLKQCEQLELYKPVKVEVEVSKGQFNGSTYVNYKLVQLIRNDRPAGK